ncbi:dual specificity protein phosphatase 22-A-like isoform X2 [Eleutherodactylus coqui]|uniref:dual specificity protein phosphatase 22-A-like isoform X2 n=2 Tax=Eleutherodactylus coqui TaxID=57060 RepID=UPI0034631120
MSHVLFVTGVAPQSPQLLWQPVSSRVMGGGMSQVLDGLYLGNIRDAEDGESLSKHGITHIVSVHSNAKALLPGMSYLCIAASDSERQNLIQYFKKSNKFIHECRMNGGGCLVHCLAGVSRSTTILVAYLMTVTALGWEECLSAVKAVRSYVGPNLGFQQQLQEYEVMLVKEYRMWLLQEYGRSPFRDRDRVLQLLSEHEQKEKLRQTQNHWASQAGTEYSLPYKAYGSRSRWSDTSGRAETEEP